MKLLFVHAKAKIDLSKSIKKIKLDDFAVYCSVQYLDEVKKYFPDAQQVLGCSRVKTEKKNILYIGDGLFHPLNLIHLNKPIYILNPLIEKFYQIPNSDIEKIKKEEKGKLIRYYHAKKVGILVTIKPGQFTPKAYITLDKKLELAYNAKKRLGKETYIFVFDTLDINELDNFPFIDMWINTACPRIKDKRIINLWDIPNKQ